MTDMDAFMARIARPHVMHHYDTPEPDCDRHTFTSADDREYEEDDARAADRYERDLERNHP